MTDLIRSSRPAAALALLIAASCAPQSQPGQRVPTATSAAKASLGFKPQFTGRAQAQAHSDAAGSASFDAPVVDANSWSGTPAGTGSFSVALPDGARSGGPQSAAANGPGGSNGMTWHQLIVADFTVETGTALGIAVDDQTFFAVGPLSIDGTHVMAALFDISTGEEFAEAITGTITLTAAGTAIGDRITGSLTGSFVATTQSNPTGSCANDSDCARGESCTAGSCTAPTPTGCSSDADCASGESCSAGSCTAMPTGCSSDEPCDAGSCEDGGCTGSAPSSCNSMQGSGSFTISQPAANVCSALSAVSLDFARALAQISAIDTSGAPAIMLVDTSDTNGDMLALELTVCPSETGTITIGNGLSAFAYVNYPHAGAHLTLYAIYEATSGSVTLTSVGSLLSGTATLGFDNGGTATASFNLQ